MKNKKAWFGILVIVLVFGIAIIGCDLNNNNGSDGEPPYEGQPPYSVQLKIDADYKLSYVNAWVYDSQNNFVSTASIKIDGVEIKKGSLNNYFDGLSGYWEQGSTHVFDITTPDGTNETGTITKPMGTLSGVVYSPLKVLAESYTISPPSGQWPSGSFLNCYIKNNGNLSVTMSPTGTDNVKFDYGLKGATEVSFYSAFKNEIQLSKFTGNSYISVIGDKTYW